jgi:hypothetical protein
LPIYIDMSVLDWDVGPLREVREGFAHALPDDDHGAKGDIFTHAFLYDLEALREDLARAPSLAQASDPAVDALEITPVHHAVAGGHVEALCWLLTRAVQANEPLLGGKRALALAVKRENVASVAKLLDLGADATTIGAGRCIRSLRRCTRAPECVSTDREIGSGSCAPEIKVEKTILNTWRLFSVTVRGSTISVRPYRIRTAGARPRSTTPPKRGS